MPLKQVHSYERQPNVGRPSTAVEVLLALGDRFRQVEAAMGAPRPWSALDLNMGQLKTLMLVIETGGLPSRDLATMLQIGRSAVTPIVDGLIDQRLVRRESSAADRRLVWIRPTPKAMRLHDVLLRWNRRVVLQRVWDAVPEMERGALEESLRLLLASAERVLETAEPTKRRRVNVR